VTHRTTGTLEGIAPGQGAVVEVAGERVAAYRDPSGRLQAVSPLCTHMKCVVHWNPVETTWDCPCHGSRFTPDGRVLCGPAHEPLEHKPLAT
jgi:Rieske Fe-S protein